MLIVKKKKVQNETIQESMRKLEKNYKNLKILEAVTIK